MSATPESRKAHVRSLTTEAVREGLLDNSRPCTVCGVAQGPTPGGSQRVALHHPDYQRPFYVIPLCRSCHAKVHEGLIPEPETGRIYTAPVRPSKMLPHVAARVREGSAPRSPDTLPPRQAAVLRFVDDFVHDNGFPPTLREICRALGIASTNGASDHVNALIGRGLLSRSGPRAARNVSLTPLGKRMADELRLAAAS
jgi:DNA-binding MarR family transcriptional regulator